MEDNEVIRDVIQRHAQAAEKERLADEYRQVDRVALSKLTDKALAEWQSAYPPGSAQFILADHEWQRRLTVDQIKAARFATIVGAVAGIGGAVIGSLITWWTSK